MFAPPAQAPTAPSPASVTSEAKVTTGMIIPIGDRNTASSGMAAPDAKVTAEVSAACTGRATVMSEMPSSSRAWAPSASLAIN